MKTNNLKSYLMSGQYVMNRHLQLKHRMNGFKKKFQCENCGKDFAFKQKLIEHSNIHTGAKPHLCRFCGKGFSGSGSRWNHEKLVHGVESQKDQES